MSFVANKFNFNQDLKTVDQEWFFRRHLGLSLAYGFFVNTLYQKLPCLEILHT
ncbi:hypothetical protein HanIR_Chr17g0874991 [Helianthus annuus]|nr:hypothetical protein HanIR_Chr17g0874991 [Helianthus annuus]